MTPETMNLGPAPRLVITAGGDLDVRGRSSATVTRVEGDSPRVQQFDGGAEITCEGSANVTLPPGGSVVVRRVEGDLTLRDLAGPLDAEQVGGSLVVRNAGDVRVLSVEGGARLRAVQGGVTLGQVGGDVLLETVEGHVQIEAVGGDLLGREVPRGVELGYAEGDVVLRTGLGAESQTRISAEGDVMLRLPAQAGVKIIAPADASLKLSQGLEALREGEQRVILIGDGAAQVEIVAASEIIIKQRSAYDEDAAFAYAFAAGSRASEQLASISEELEAQFAVLEASLSEDISDRVRRQVEKRLNSARRQVDAAQRWVENAHQPTPSPAPPVEPAGEPVSEQERLLILQMLEQGTITVEEAERLLSALEGGD